MTEDTWYGFTGSELLEIKRVMDKEGSMDHIREIAKLRSKVSFYESRIKQLNGFMQINLEVPQDGCRD